MSLEPLLHRARHAEVNLHALPAASTRRWLRAAGWTLRLLPAIMLVLTVRVLTVRF